MQDATASPTSAAPASSPLQPSLHAAVMPVLPVNNLSPYSPTGQVAAETTRPSSGVHAHRPSGDAGKSALGGGGPGRSSPSGLGVNKSPLKRTSGPKSKKRSTNYVPGQTCANCGTDSTSLWRRDKASDKPLCNACGIYLQNNGRARPTNGLFTSVGKTGKTRIVHRTVSSLVPFPLYVWTSWVSSVLAAACECFLKSADSQALVIDILPTSQRACLLARQQCLPSALHMLAVAVMCLDRLSESIVHIALESLKLNPKSFSPHACRPAGASQSPVTHMLWSLPQSTSIGRAVASMVIRFPI